MKDLSTWLLVMFMAMFWIFRVIVAFTTQYEMDFCGFEVFNFNIEVGLLFITILCFILVLRRNIIGGILYLVSYGYYFGSYILQTAIPEFSSTRTMGMITAQNTMVSLLGILLALLVFGDLLLTRIRRRSPTDKKTDWFFQNEQFDRKYDERADRNEYKNY